MTKTYHVLRPAELRPTPTRYEEKVAEICALHFRSDVMFVVRSGHTTPDLEVVRMKQFWEVKNIRGSSNHTVEDNLRKASKQSENVIISLLSSKMDTKRTEARIRHILRTKRMPLKRVLLITRTGIVIDIK